MLDAACATKGLPGRVKAVVQSRWNFLRSAARANTHSLATAPGEDARYSSRP